MVERLNGQWPLTPDYAPGRVVEPEVVGDSARVSATFSTFGTIRAYALTVTFDDADRITLLDETVTMYPSPAPSAHIPPVVRTAINGALANGTPLVVAYTGGDGIPALLLRGSVEVWEVELCLWVRNPKSGCRRARKGRSWPSVNTAVHDLGHARPRRDRGRRGPRADLVAFAGGRESATIPAGTGSPCSSGSSGCRGTHRAGRFSWRRRPKWRGPGVPAQAGFAELMDAARALAPEIVRKRVEIENDRRLPASLVEQLGGAPVRALVAPRARRPRASPDRARPRHRGACAGGRLGRLVRGRRRHVQPIRGQLLEDAAREIFGGRSVVAGSFRPSGRAVAVEGGFRVTGGWSFGSGIHHSSWLAVIASAHGDAPDRAAGVPETRFVFLPTSAAEVIDTWNVTGLRGTGSQDFRVVDVFVPGEHATSGFPSPPVQPGALYGTAVESLVGSLAAVAWASHARRSPP